MEESFEKKLFIAEELETKNGYTYTLASRLGDMLNMAEKMFGKRDKTYTILGIEFSNDGPQLWYPGNCKSIVIQLNINALNDEHRACFQLSQEVVHLISPTGKRDATNLEEGLATYFGDQYMKKNFPDSPWRIEKKSYLKVKKLVEELLTIDPEIIKKVREGQPTISKIKKEDLISVNDKIKKSSAEELTKDF